MLYNVDKWVAMFDFCKNASTGMPEFAKKYSVTMVTKQQYRYYLSYVNRYTLIYFVISAELNNYHEYV